MARQRRNTEPLDTIHGRLTDYAVIDGHLLDGEFRGRAWIFERAQDAAALSTYDDHDIRRLHRVMFGDLLPWAGEFRRDDRGPGGKVPVPWYQVPVAVREFTDNLRVWVASLPPDPALEQLANLVADAHHKFQWIHPFQDTNGRTGRVLDLYLLWVTFGLKGTRSRHRRRPSPSRRRSMRTSTTMACKRRTFMTSAAASLLRGPYRGDLRAAVGTRLTLGNHATNWPCAIHPGGSFVLPR